jgi:hypothetical protein
MRRLKRSGPLTAAPGQRRRGAVNCSTNAGGRVLTHTNALRATNAPRQGKQRRPQARQGQDCPKPPQIEAPPHDPHHTKPQIAPHCATRRHSPRP